ncbi:MULTISPECIES: hypothetical protein [unclassified Clostridium]|uniref:hypothetical protein n=1 Tax=unclassified Clostridium TaxID=2614128 RepID=UPI0032178F74
MDININVNFNCRELIKVLTLSARFFQALDEKESEALGTDGELPKDKEEGLIWKLEDAKEEKLKGQDAYVLCKDEVTLGDIREKLAAMSQKGDHERVRQLLIKYGGERLSDVPRENYVDLLKEANEVQ